MRHLALFIVCLINFNSFTFAQEHKNSITYSYPDDHIFYDFKTLDSIQYSLSTPYHTIHTQLENLEEGNYHPQVAAKVFSDKLFTQKEREQLAIKLKLIYFSRGVYLNSQEFPLEKNYIDPKTKTTRYFISPKLKSIYLEKVEDGDWLYSEYSTKRINDIFKDIYPSFTSELALFASKIQQSKNTILGINVLQLLTLMGLCVFSYLFYYVSKWTTKKAIRIIFPELHREDATKLILPKFRRPVAMMILMAIWYYIAPFIFFSDNMIEVSMTIFKLTFSFHLIQFLFYFADLLVMQVELYLERKEGLDTNLVPVLRVSFRILFIMFGLLGALKLNGFNISKLVTGISFGGVALAFAAQDTVKNFFGSIMILVDQPFKVGDWVKIDTEEGIVEEIGFRTTRIRTFTDSLLNIPNGILMNGNIDNLGKRQLRRFNTNLSIPYNTPTKKIEAFMEEVIQCVLKHPKTKKDFYQVRLNNLSKSSLDVLLYVYFETNSWTEELKDRESLLLEILKASERVDVPFAFPTQTLYIEKDDRDTESPNE